MRNKMKETNKMLLALLILIIFAVVMWSCNVTRTITTTAQHYQHGDTTTPIITKTTESYDATKKGL